ncbi:MAG: efflux RND transporter periplasmic adaptor subunit [Bacteroidales bacterium]|nr:efflux RND transporter periplasmic adaptor subunit [Bacteroidales bacterium]
MNKRYIKIVFGCILLSLVCFIALYRHSEDRSMQTTSPIRRDLVVFCKIYGQVKPATEIQIKSTVNGILVDLYKNAGDIVEEGEAIAMLKVLPEIGAVNSTRNRLEVAKVKREYATKQYERDSALFASNSISRSDLEDAEEALSLAELEYESAKSALDILLTGENPKTKDRPTLIKSTISGMIMDTPAQVGETVIAATNYSDGTCIAKISDLDSWIFEGYADQIDVGKLKQGQELEVEVGAIGRRLSGMISFVSPKSENRGGVNQYLIRSVVFVPEGIELRSGYGAIASMEINRKNNVICVPEAAITYSDTLSFVTILGEKGESTSLRIDTGLSDGIYTEILTPIDLDCKVLLPILGKGSDYDK